MQGDILFRYTDDSGDEVVIKELATPRINIFTPGAGPFMDRDAVLSLIQALNEWAYPTHTPEGPNRSLIEELIAKAVKDQVSAVLPLHLSPVSSVRTRGGRCEGCRYGNHPHVFKACERTGCECLDTVAEHRPQECPGAGQCPEADPEPGDVGHPRPAACTLSQPIFKADDSECSECGGRWADHPGVQAARADWLVHVSRPAECEARPPAEHPFTAVHDACGHLWATHCATPEPPVAEDGPCADCGHGKDRHRPVCAKYTVGKGVCRCNVYKAPLPVREKTVIVPICGLCEQPWSDGHGQPGDPCPGVEAAREHPGDWTDALWRVKQLCGACASGNHPHVFRPCTQAGCACTESAPEQPSAPASEARYCDECGHSWEVHPERLVADTWCTAVKGKGRCQCEKRRPE